jgi:MFS family permease
MQRVRFSVAILTLMNLFNYMDRYVLPAVLTRVEDALHFKHGRAGIVGSAFVIVYFAVAPIFGRLGDRVRSRRVVIAVGVAFWSLASAGTGLATGFWTLLLGRSLVGVGEAAYATITPSLIGDYYPPEKRGPILTLFNVATPVGAALGYLLGGMIAKAASWRVAFFATGLPGLALAAGMLFVVEPPRGRYDEDKASDVALGDALRMLIKNRRYVTTVIGYTLATFAVGGLAYWMPTYLERVRGMNLEKADSLMGTYTVLAGLSGTIFGGWIAERMGKRYLFVSAVSSMACAPVAVAVFMVHGPAPLTNGLLLAALFLVFIPTGPINAVLVNSVPPSVRATAMAICIFVIHLGGDAFSPSLIGGIAELTSLRAAVMLVPLAIGLGGIVWMGAVERPSS